MRRPSSPIPQYTQVFTRLALFLRTRRGLDTLATLERYLRDTDQKDPDKDE